MDAMTEASVLQIVTKALEHAAIPYMITGSFASNFYGIPRTTRDIDIVIAASPEQLKDLIQQLQDKNYYAQIEDALDALRHHSMFNAIEPSMVWKIDFIMRTPGTFSQEAFRRSHGRNCGDYSSNKHCRGSHHCETRLGKAGRVL